MDSLIQTFHIDLKLFISQIINFAIVISILYFFVLKPLLKVMNDRNDTIEKSLLDAKKVEENMAKTDLEYRNILAQAHKEANEIVKKANIQAEKRKEEIIKKAKDDIAVIISQEKSKLQTDRENIIKEIKKDVSSMVVFSLEKILHKNIDQKEDFQYIKNIMDGA